MDSPIIQSEETSASRHPATNFNIASAFPVSNEIERGLRRAKWVRRKEWVFANPEVVVLAALGLLALYSGTRGAGRADD